MIPDHLRLQPGQEALTPEQEAEARRFAEVRIAAQLSTEPVNEPEAEALLKQAYQAAGLPPPQSIHSMDGPLALVATLASPDGSASVEADGWERAWENGWVHEWGSVDEGLGERVWESVLGRVEERVADSGWERVWGSGCDNVRDSVWTHVEHRVGMSLYNRRVWPDVRKSVYAGLWDRTWEHVPNDMLVENVLEASVWAYGALTHSALLRSQRGYHNAMLSGGAPYPSRHPGDPPE
jgi:hypothetical protein